MWSALNVSLSARGRVGANCKGGRSMRDPVSTEAPTVSAVREPVDGRARVMLVRRVR